MNSDPTTGGNLQSDSARRPQRAWVSLGGNVPWEDVIGAPLFKAALEVLQRHGFDVRSASRLWTGPAWPDPSDPPFFNAVVEGLWAGKPEDLMALLLDTEARFGRVRGLKNAPRTLDLDLLDMELAAGFFPGGLELPHPRVAERAFVLGPLSEASPDWRDRKSGLSAAALMGFVENSEFFQPIGVFLASFSPNSGKP